MTWRFTLIHDTLGALEIPEPGGWKDHKLKSIRHPEFFSMVESLEAELVFYGKSVDFINEVESQYGSEAELRLYIEVSEDDDNFTDYWTGKLTISALRRYPNNTIVFPVLSDTFWDVFLSRMETPVNLSDTVDLDGNAVDPVEPITVLMTPQIIRKKFDGHLLDSRALRVDTDGIDVGDFIQLDVDEYIINEINDKHTIPIINGEASMQPQALITFEEPGETEIDIRYELSLLWYDSPVTCPDVVLYIDSPENYIDLYIQINNEDPIAFNKTTEINNDEESCVYTYSDTREFNVTDTIKIYAVLESALTGFNEPIYIWLHSKNNSKTIQKPIVTDGGGGECLWNGATEDDPLSLTPPSEAETPSYLRLLQKTTHPSTQAQGYLIHDLFHGVLARLGLGPDPFYSDLLGASFTKAKTYSSDGCGSMYTVLKGLQIRQYSLVEKPFFISFRDVWTGINPILNLGLGYELIDDTPMIRVEGKAHFVGNSISVNFPHIQDISSQYDPEYMFKTVKPGYKKWQSEDISGIDDPQTKHTYATILKSGQDLDIESAFIAASLAIETTRRTTKEKSADYKYDNDNFIIAINTNDISPDVFVPELDELFQSVTNLLDPETRYNLLLTPGRLMLNWRSFTNGALQSYSGSVYKFVSGEGNYDMESDADTTAGAPCFRAINFNNFSEKQDISVTSSFYFLPILYRITIPMTKEEFDLIDRKRPIGISQTSTGFTSFVIKDMAYDTFKGQAEVNAWPKLFFPINVIEQDIEASCSEAGIEYDNNDFSSSEFY